MLSSSVRVSLIFTCSIGLFVSYDLADARTVAAALLTAKAYDANTLELLYTEENIYDEDPDDGTLNSRFYNANGELIGVRKIQFKDNKVQSYQITQARIGYTNRLERRSSAIDYATTRNGKTRRKSLTSSASENIVIDAGLFNLVVREWATLLAGQKVKFDIAAPDNIRSVGMTIEKINFSDSLAPQILLNKTIKDQIANPRGLSATDKNVVAFTMTITNPLLRLIVDTIEFGYYHDSKQLAYFAGPSNLKGENGKTIDPVYIVYDRS